jgi:hypothetical protein
MVAESLAHIRNEIELLSIENDDAVGAVLEQIGFDLEYPVSYIPAKHRNMQGKVVIGFLAVGEINMNRSFINSRLCTLTERMIAAAYTDPSLTRELGNLMGMRANFRTLLDNGNAVSNENLPEDMLEPDRDIVLQQLKDLEAVRDAIRGPLYNDRGEAKTYAEYKEPPKDILINKKRKK